MMNKGYEETGIPTKASFQLDDEGLFITIEEQSFMNDGEYLYKQLSKEEAIALAHRILDNFGGNDGRK